MASDYKTIFLPYQLKTVIVSGGYEVGSAEALNYAGRTKEFYVAGDCDRKSATIMPGILQAFGRVNLI